MANRSAGAEYNDFYFKVRAYLNKFAFQKLKFNMFGNEDLYFEINFIDDKPYISKWDFIGIRQPTLKDLNTLISKEELDCEIYCFIQKYRKIKQRSQN